MPEITRRYVVKPFSSDGIRGYRVVSEGKHVTRDGWWSTDKFEILPGKVDGVDAQLFVLERDINYDGCGSDSTRIVGVSRNERELRNKMWEYVQAKGRDLASGPDSKLVMKAEKIGVELKKCKEITTVNTGFRMNI
jgi:hypothetical protein